MPRILLFISCLFFSISLFADPKLEDQKISIIKTLTELSKEIPERYLSLDGVAEYHEYDEKKIIPWVTTNIQYSPSVGYQLTAENTLKTLSGNALEQAVFLQTILTQAGFEVRISKTTLDDATAIELLKQSFINSPARYWTFKPNIEKNYLKKLAELHGKTVHELLDRNKRLTALIPWLNSKIYTDANKLSMQLYTALEKEKAWKLSSNAMKPWIDIAKDYYFVKYRLSQGDKWTQAHPAFLVNAPVIEKSTYFTSDIKTQYHQISLQAFITRKIGEKKETIAVTPLIERNSLQLFKHQLEFITIPANLETALKTKSLNLLYESKSFIPTVDGKILKGTRIFGVDGKDYSADNILDPSQRLANSININTKGVSTSLNSIEKPLTDKKNQNKSSELLDYHIKISWKSPRGDVRNIKRMIYQKGGEKLSISNSIIQRILLATESAVFSPAALLNKQFRTQISLLKLGETLKQKNISEESSLRETKKWVTKHKDNRFNAILTLSNLVPTNKKVFSVAPMLALVWERGNDNNERIITSSFDYLINSSQVATLSNNQLSIDPLATMAHGIWSTYSEALVQAKIKIGQKDLSRDELPKDGISAANQFNKLIEGKNGFVINKDPEKFTVLSNTTRALLAEEFENNPNQILIVPTKRPKKGMLAFYKINIKTGETLGYSENLRGLASIEYGVGLAGGAVVFATKYRSCRTSDGLDAWCVTCGVVQGVVAMIALTVVAAGATAAATAVAAGMASAGAEAAVGAAVAEAMAAAGASTASVGEAAIAAAGVAAEAAATSAAASTGQAVAAAATGFVSGDAIESFCNETGG